MKPRLLGNLVGTNLPYFTIGNNLTIDNVVGSNAPLVTTLKGRSNMEILLDFPNPGKSKVVTINGKLIGFTGGVTRVRAVANMLTASTYSTYYRVLVFPNDGNDTFRINKVVYKLSGAFGSGSADLTLGNATTHNFYSVPPFDIGSTLNNGNMFVVEHYELYTSQEPIYAYWPTTHNLTSGQVEIFLDLDVDDSFCDGVYY